MLCVADEFGLFSWNCCITECRSWACCSLEVSLRHFHLPIISLRNTTQQGKQAVILGSAWTPEFQRVNLAWDLKLCGLKRKGESSDRETKKPECSQLKKKCKVGEETGPEERNRRATFCGKEAIFTAEDQRNWLDRIKKVRSPDPWEKPWAEVRAISGSLTKTYRGLKSGELRHRAPHCSFTISPQSATCTGENERWQPLAPFVKSGVFCTLALLWRNKL